MSEFINLFPIYLRILILCNFLTVVVGTTLVLIYNFIYDKNYKRYNNLKEIFTDLVGSIIFEKQEILKDDLKLIESYGVYKSKNVRKIFIETLKSFKNFLKGDEEEILDELYDCLNFENYSLKALNSLNENNIVSAIEELRQFQKKIDKETIIKFQKHKNRKIREVANYYVLSVCDDDIYNFLDFPEQSFTKWEQLEYFQLITKRSKIKKPHFRKWINPKYDSSIIRLALDLVAYYYQDNATENIHELLKNPDESLKQKLITTLGKVGSCTSIPILIDLYPKETCINCKREILKSLGYIGNNDNNINAFLTEVYNNEKNLDLKKTSILALKHNTQSVNTPVTYHELGAEIIKAIT